MNKRDLRASEQMSKRRRGYQSKRMVKRGVRVMHGGEERYEKLEKKFK